MPNQASNVTAGKPKIGGAVFRAPMGTALPVTANELLDTAFHCLGYVSDDGLTNASGIDSEEVRSWGGNVVLSITKERTDTFAFTFLEATNAEVLKTFYGDGNVSGDLSSGITIRANSSDVGTYSWIIDMLLRNGAIKRIVIPNGKVTATGDVVYKDDDATAYDITVTAMEDASGNTHYEYIQGAASASGSATVSVALNKAELSIDTGETQTLTATTTPTGGTVVWSSGDTSVATVSDGVVTGVSAGTTNITASYVGAVASCTVIVTGT